MQADQAEQAYQQLGWQHVQQRVQQSLAVSQLKRLDPEVQAAARREYGVRVAFAWGVALSGYFVLGWGILKSVLGFMATGFVVRVFFALLRLRWPALKRSR